MTANRYLGLPAIQSKAGGHVRLARRYWGEALNARRHGYPDVAFSREERSRHHLSVARWMAAGCPSRPLTAKRS